MKKQPKDDYRYFKIFIIILNILGISCLIYFSIPYLKHDMSIPNPNAMLSSYLWDSCGFVLTLGLIPLITVNTLAYILIDLKNKKIKFIYFMPSILCFLIVCHYLFIATDWNGETESESEHIATIDCAINENQYAYKIYQEKNGEFSLEMDDDDKIPISNVDYTSKDSITKSIENYYKNNGGSCS